MASWGGEGSPRAVTVGSAEELGIPHPSPASVTPGGSPGAALTSPEVRVEEETGDDLEEDKGEGEAGWHPTPSLGRLPPSPGAPSSPVLSRSQARSR